MAIVLFDTEERKKLYPLTYTRATGDIRMGIFTMNERWQLAAKQEAYILTEPYLQCLYKQLPAEDNLYINASVIASRSLEEKILALEQDAALYDAEGLIAGRIHATAVTDYKSLVTGIFKTKNKIENVKRLEYSFNIFQWNDELIRRDFKLITGNRISQPLSPTNKAIQPENIFIEQGAVVEHAILNASAGPIYIGNNATIMEGCLIRGPFVMNEGAVLKMGTKIYGAVTLGPYCMGGGEIKNVVMQGYSNKGHDGYLGDSVIGEWCNLGAGTSNSNVKNTGSDVKIWDCSTNAFINAGNKCGLIMGDYSRTAINSSINTGSVIGVCCNVFGEGLLPKVIPDFTWGAKESKQYELDKALQDVANWKKMKQQNLTGNEAAVLKHIFTQFFKITIMRKQIAAANWKMNLTVQQAQQLLDDVLNKQQSLSQNQQVVFAVPSPYLFLAQQKAEGKTNVFIAAQNCYSKKSGAYTGEVSVEMLQSLNIHHVVLGHSERREHFNESNELLAEKINICLEHNITPIFCCGEPLPVREANTQNEFVAKQLQESLFHLTAGQLQKVEIAYEPIWAIGTGKTATSQQAQQMHAYIRSQIAEKYGQQVADDISILYGGSVKANNAKEIFSQPDVDGGLVGGASLNADEFVAIINSLKQ